MVAPGLPVGRGLKRDPSAVGYDCDGVAPGLPVGRGLKPVSVVLAGLSVESRPAFRSGVG